MASPQTMSDEAGNKKCMTCLPKDMIQLILARLPMRTLVRCRAVCKQWDNIIRDPEFIMEHLQGAPRCPLLFSHQESCPYRLYPSEVVFFDEAWLPSKWDAPIVDPDDFLCASCNGLVLLYSDKSAIKIANIATGECLHLAKPGKKLKGDCYTFYNFGYHPVTKQYKVIRFLAEEQVPAGSFSAIQVYNLGDDNWRDVIAPRAQSLEYIEFFGVVNVDGAMYWLTEEKESSSGCAVVSFDLDKECFEWVKLPAVDLANCAPGHAAVFNMTEVDGKVCVVKAQNSLHATRGLVGNLQIWTLESKVHQSWSQKYNVQLSSTDIYIARPYLIHGDKIVMHDPDGNLYCHTLMGQNIEIDQRDMMKLLNYSPHHYSNMRLYMHAKSLVRLDAYNRAAIVVSPKRRNSWELKKWEEWRQKLYSLQSDWLRIYKSACSITERASAMGIDVDLRLEPPPEKIVQCRLNWLEQKRVEEMLNASTKRLNLFEVMEQTRATPKTFRRFFKGESSSAASNSDP